MPVTINGVPPTTAQQLEFRQAFGIESRLTAAEQNAAAAAEAAAAAYTPPVSGIPATKLSTAVQTDLSKGGTSVQSVNGLTPDADGNVVVAVSAGSVSSNGITDSGAIGRQLVQAVTPGAAKSVLSITIADVASLTATLASKADASAVTSISLSALDSTVQSSLAKADTALQSVPFGTTAGTAAQGNDSRLAGNVKSVNGALPDAAGNVAITVSAGTNIAASSLSTAVQASLSKADSALQPGVLPAGTTIPVAQITGLGTAGTQPVSAFATAAQGVKADSALQTLPIATTSVLGGVKAGSGLAVAADGTLSTTGTAATNATTAAAGVVQLADAAAVTAGTSGRVVDAAQLKAVKDAAAPANAAITTLTVSRNATAADNGAIIDARGTAGLTLTIPAGLSPMPAFIVQCHTGGTTVAFGAGVKNNGTASPASVVGTDTVSVLPTATANDYKVSKSTAAGSIALADLGASVQASLAKADTALQVAPVTTVAGRTGAVTLTTADISGLGTAATQASSAFATAAQGVKADSALQTLPVATAIVLGGVKVGSGLAVAGDGTLSATGTAATNATTTAVGVVQLAGDLGGTATAPTVPGLASKQATLVSGTNIKTVGGVSVLGSGDITLANIGAATAAQGVKADSALQPGVLPVGTTIPVAQVTGLGTAATQASTAFAPAPSATVSVAASRSLTNDDAGKTLEVTASGVTLTVPNGLTLTPGVIVQKHTSGTSIAFSGGALGNGLATTLAITAQMAAIVPTTVSDAYRVAGV
jgi:hypothetical protein